DVLGVLLAGQLATADSQNGGRVPLDESREGGLLTLRDEAFQQLAVRRILGRRGGLSGLPCHVREPPGGCPLSLYAPASRRECTNPRFPRSRAPPGNARIARLRLAALPLTGRPSRRRRAGGACKTLRSQAEPGTEGRRSLQDTAVPGGAWERGCVLP